MVIDSRCGEDFATFAPGGGDGSGPAIAPRFDACASWWTQVPGCNHSFQQPGSCTTTQ